MTESLAAVFLLIGGFFLLLGSLGLVRLPDIYCRMHAATKATTLGLSGVLIATFFVLPGHELGAKAFLAIAFAFLTAPVGAHMIGRAAYRYPVKMTKESCCDELGPDLAKAQLGPPCPDRDPTETD